MEDSKNLKCMKDMKCSDQDQMTFEPQTCLNHASRTCNFRYTAQKEIRIAFQKIREIGVER